MKIVIHGNADELAARGDDLKKVVDRLVDRLCKADKADHNMRPLDYKALQGAVDRSSKHVRRIQRVMLQRMKKVVDGDPHG